jgi:hypothetical protein
LDGQNLVGWSFSGERVDLVDENLRHEFRTVETRLEVRFDDDSKLTALWPAEEGRSRPTGFFALRHHDVAVTRAARVAEVFPSIGLVPVLSPLDQEERVLSPKYLQQHMSSRLSSRHFRNQLWLMREAGELDEFFAYIEPHVPEITLRQLEATMGADGRALDLYYWDAGSRTDKEIFWAGDGIQIWLQILLHLHRLRDADAVVLDEPDVFLHPDLQRRLVRVLESLSGQTITATHPAEVLAEADRDSLVWVTRQRRVAVRPRDPNMLQLLSESLGSGFNLRVAKALHARSAVFVEGGDAKTLNRLARAVGARALEREAGIAVVELEGFDRWELVEPFVWFISSLLEDAVAAYVLLDRDYRSDGLVSQVKKKMLDSGIRCHIWARHELENYLLVPEAIGRMTGLDAGASAKLLDEAAECLAVEVLGGLSQALAQEMSGTGTSVKTISTAAKKRMDTAWTDPAQKLALCPGKELIRELNKQLVAEGRPAVSARALSSKLRRAEVDPELVRVLLAIDQNDEL